MRVFAKAYKLDSAQATKIKGGLTAAQVPLLPVESISSIKKILEGDVPALFRMAGLSMTCVGLPEDHFGDHNEDDLGEHTDDPYVVEVQYGPAWDDAASRVIFYGVLEGKSVRYDPTTEKTSFSVLSLDKALVDSKPVQARSIYRSRVVKGFDAQKPRASTYNWDFTVRDFGSIADYLEAGSTIVGTARYGEDVTFQTRLVVAGVITSATDSTLPADEYGVLVARRAESGLERGPYSTWSFKPGIAEYGTIFTPPVRSIVSLDRDAWGILPSKMEGMVARLSAPGTQTYFRIERAEYGFAWWETPMRETIEITLDRDVPDEFTDGVGDWYIYEPMAIDPGSEVEIWGAACFGKGDTPPIPLEYPAADLIEGIAESNATLAILTNGVTPAVSSAPAPIRITRLAMPSSNLGDALSEIQIASESYVQFEPYQGATGRIASGARLVQIRVDSRASLATGTNIPVPINWSGEAVGDKWRYVVVEGDVSINEPQIGSVETVVKGWYPDDIIDVESLDGDGVLKFEDRLTVPVGTGRPFIIGRTTFLNEGRLKEQARRYWNFYSKFYRRQTIVVDGIYDFSSQPGSGSFQSYLGRILNGTVSPVLKSGLCIAQSVDYLKSETVFDVLVQDGTVDTTNLAPIAILYNAGTITAHTGAVGTGSFDASASYDPDGQALTFSWKKNTVPLASTSATLVEDVEDGDIIEVTVSDGTLTDTASVTASVIQRPRPPVNHSYPPYLTAYVDPVLSDETDAVITIRGNKPGSYMTYEYQVIENGVPVRLYHDAWATATPYVEDHVVLHGGETYVCILDHTSGASSEPGVGASWATYWSLENVYFLEIDNAGSFWDGEIDTTLTIARPVETIASPDPYKHVILRAYDVSARMASPWVGVAVTRSRAASILGLTSYLVDGSTLHVAWDGDADTASVTIRIDQQTGPNPDADYTTINTYASQAASGDTNFALAAWDSSKPLLVRAIPYDSSPTAGPMATFVVQPGTVDGAGLEWEGPWVTSTAYQVNDVVLVGTRAFVCILDHTSGASSQPGVGASWTTYWDYMSGFYWAGAWATSTTYYVGDVVSNDGSSYVCTAQHTSGASTEPGVGASWDTYWDLQASKGDAGADGQDGADGADGISPTVYYIKPTNGTAIKNSAGTLTVEAHQIVAGVDSLIAAGTIQLYVGTTLVTVANGYATGSDGYTGVFDAGDISGNVVVTLKDGSGGTPLDTITLVDVTDGADGADGSNGTDGDDAVYGYVEATNGLAWTRAANAGSWTPAGTTTKLNFTFVQGGVEVIRDAYQVTLNTADGTLTASGAVSHDGGDLSYCQFYITGSGTTALTIRAVSSLGGGESVSETIVTAQGGMDGDDGTPGDDGTGEVIVFRRLDVQPTTPTGSTVPPTDWSLAPPAADGNPLWMSKATFLSGVLQGSWSTPVRISGDDIPKLNALNFYWGNLTSIGQTIVMDASITNGDSVEFRVLSGVSTVPPTTSTAFLALTDNRVINFALNSAAISSGTQQTLGGSIDFGNARTVWIRAVDTEAGVSGYWQRHLMTNDIFVQMEQVEFLDATTTAGDKRDVRLRFALKDKTGYLKLQYKIETSTTDPTSGWTTSAAFNDDDPITIADQQTTTISGATLTRRYFHFRLLGNDSDILTKWKFVEMPYGEAISVTLEGEAMNVSGSTFYDQVLMYLNKPAPGPIYWEQTAGSPNRILLGSPKTPGEYTYDGTNYVYTFTTKNYTMTSEATYRFRIYSANMNLLYEGTETAIYA